MKDVGFIVAAQNLHCGVNIRLEHPIECLSIIGGIELPEHELAVPGERGDCDLCVRPKSGSDTE